MLRGANWIQLGLTTSFSCGRPFCLEPANWSGNNFSAMAPLCYACPPCYTRVMAEYEIWEPLQCKSVFNTYLSLGRSNQKVEESGLAFFWPNWSSSDLPNPNTNTQIHKHTNTQIQHMTKCQKDPTCSIFLKRGLLKYIKNFILGPMAFKKYRICWVFLALCHMLYLCICEFVFVYLCIWLFKNISL